MQLVLRIEQGMRSVPTASQALIMPDAGLEQPFPAQRMLHHLIKTAERWALRYAAGKVDDRTDVVALEDLLLFSVVIASTIRRTLSDRQRIRDGRVEKPVGLPCHQDFLAVLTPDDVAVAEFLRRRN
jgi:hypothetical protein